MDLFLALMQGPFLALEILDLFVEIFFFLLHPTLDPLEIGAALSNIGFGFGSYANGLILGFKDGFFGLGARRC